MPVILTGFLEHSCQDKGHGTVLVKIMLRERFSTRPAPEYFQPTVTAFKVLSMSQQHLQSLTQWLNILSNIPFRLMVHVKAHKLLISSGISTVPKALFIAGNVLFGFLNTAVFGRVIYSDLIKQHKKIQRPKIIHEADGFVQLLDYQLH